MSKLALKRTNTVGFVSILVLSSATMLWLYWHHPVGTAVVTLVILASLAISARLARLIENDGQADVGHG